MKIAIVLLTGFLGSGKTTLLNRLLEQKKQVEGVVDLAVVVNEFGDVGVDGELLAGDEVKQVELPGGCVCCQLDEDLEKTLNSMISDYPNLKQIIIETTGIAEPLPISWTLSKKELAKRVRLSAVVTVVDALEIDGNLEKSPSTENQIEFADLIYVSKCGLAESKRLAALAPKIKKLNNHAPLIFDNAEESLAELTVMIHDIEQSDLSEERKLRQKHNDELDNRHSFESASLPIDSTLDMEELTEQLENLPSNYIRIKGVASIYDGESKDNAAKPMAFHRVGSRVSFDDIEDLNRGKLVAIGKSIDEEVLRGCIKRSSVS